MSNRRVFYEYPELKVGQKYCPKCSGSGEEVWKHSYLADEYMDCWECQGSGVVMDTNIVVKLVFLSTNDIKYAWFRNVPSMTTDEAIIKKYNQIKDIQGYTWEVERYDADYDLPVRTVAYNWNNA